MIRIERRLPILGIGIQAARRLRKEVGYEHPTELAIEALAWSRGALVAPEPITGARGNLVKVDGRAVIGVGAGLSDEERRWAIAHELGHFEAHGHLSFLALCSSRDMVSVYQASGREPEANAFAAELLMPEDLVRPRCDVARVSWQPIRAIAEDFRVSVTAAALRFVAFTDERVCLVCAKDGVVTWTSATRDFGPTPRRGAKLDPYSECHDWFRHGRVEAKPQTVSASAWLEDADDDEDIVEHVFPLPRYGAAMSLLWRHGG